MYALQWNKCLIKNAHKNIRYSKTALFFNEDKIYSTNLDKLNWDILLLKRNGKFIKVNKFHLKINVCIKFIQWWVGKRNNCSMNCKWNKKNKNKQTLKKWIRKFVLIFPFFYCFSFQMFNYFIYFTRKHFVLLAALSF